MKKLITLMLALAAIVAFVSCDKNAENKNSLVGTTWVANIDVDVTGTIEFKTKTDCDVISTYPDGSETIKGTYVYNAPKITITANQVTASGTVDGNKMTITGGGETLVFTKKQ